MDSVSSCVLARGMLVSQGRVASIVCTALICCVDKRVAQRSIQYRDQGTTCRNGIQLDRGWNQRRAGKTSKEGTGLELEVNA